MAIFKAFDKVWLDDIILKVKHNGISDNILNLLFNYLRNGKQGAVLSEQVYSLTGINS